MTHVPDPDLIDRYLAGDASPRDMERIAAIRDADPQWAESIDALAAELREPRAPTWNVDAAWSRLAPRLATTASASPVRAAPPANRTSYRPDARRWLAAAAVLAAVAGLMSWTASRRAVPTTATLAHEVATPNGTRHTLTLDDGTRVTLNAGSRLRWGADFGRGGRDVWLEGEAYFVVAHDASHPFRVHARGAIARDLGTRFSVRAYPELSRLEVVVAEGSVSLRRDRADAGDSAVLVAGQLGRIDSAGVATVESNVRVDHWTAWTGGALILEDVSLGDAIPQIERWYDAAITVADSDLARKRVTARFHDETLPQMLDALSLALDARWQRNGRSITITPGRP